MTTSRERYIVHLLHEIATQHLFSDELVSHDILQGHNIEEYVDMYENAYQQKPELFQKIEDTLNEYLYNEDFEPSPLMWALFETYFNGIWTYVINTYYEGYPLPEKMEFPNLLDLDIDLI